MHLFIEIRLTVSLRIGFAWGKKVVSSGKMRGNNEKTNFIIRISFDGMPGVGGRMGNGRCPYPALFLMRPVGIRGHSFTSRTIAIG